MFTGIIEEVGTVKSMRAGSLAISADKVLEGMREGDSIDVNGACLTVTAISGSSFSVDLAPETMRRTNLGLLRPSDRVNLERPLTLSGRLGGHLVEGHVDATGRLVSVEAEAGAVLARYAAPSQIMRYVVEKGFIAVDGASLTVMDYDSTSFRVSLVPYTLAHTISGERRPGDLVNLEVDIIAKYVERLQGKDSSGVTVDFLAEHGFL